MSAPRPRSGSGRLTDEDGYVLPIVISVLLILTLFGLAAVALSITSVTVSQTDRNRQLALAAADEGADVAGWRLNHVLNNPATASLLGFTDNLLSSLGCVNVNAPGVTASVSELGSANLGPITIYVQGSQGASTPTTIQGASCPSTGAEPVGNDAYFSYQMETNVNLPLSAGNPLSSGTPQLQSILGQTVERRAVVTGSANGQTRRILVTYRLNPSTLIFYRYRYVECTTTTTSSTFGAGCNDPGY